MKNHKILYYTDCFIFGGCEKPLFEVMSFGSFRQDFVHRLIYRTTREYRSGLKKAFPHFDRSTAMGILLPDPNTWIHRLQLSPRPFVLTRIYYRLCLLLFRLLLPLIVLYEFLVLFTLFLFSRSRVTHINNGGYPGAMSCRIAAVAARAAGHKSIIMSVHNMASVPRGYWDGLLDRAVDRSVDLFITGSRASGRVLAANRGFSSKKIVNIYHGVPANESLYEKQKVSNRLITMVALLEPRKGHRYVLSAFKKTIQNRPELKDLKLVLIGDGPDADELKKLSEDLGIQEQVDFLGYQSDYLKHVANSWFLLNPSTEREDLPLIIIEALSVGIPVIGSNVAGIPEEIEDGVNGLIVPPADADAISDAMVHLLTDEATRMNMAKEARRIFNEKFTKEVMIEQYKEIYRDFISKNGPT